jgi:hypothetical protein
MIFNPPTWLYNAMQLTETPFGFKISLVLISVVGFGIATLGEKYFLPRLARFAGEVNLLEWCLGGAGKGGRGGRGEGMKMKKRKKYKVVEELMRF